MTTKLFKNILKLCYASIEDKAIGLAIYAGLNVTDTNPFLLQNLLDLFSHWSLVIIDEIVQFVFLSVVLSCMWLKLLMLHVTYTVIPVQCGASFVP